MPDLDVTDGRSKEEEQETPKFNENTLLESEYPTNTITLESKDKYARTTLSAGLLRKLLDSGLWLSFLNYVDRNYIEPDKLLNSRFALGLRIILSWNLPPLREIPE